MNNTKLISEYIHPDGGVAKIYRVITAMDGDHSYFSITYKDKNYCTWYCAKKGEK